MNCVSKLKSSGRVRVLQKKKSMEKYVVPTDGLLDEYRDILKLSPLKDRIVAHSWSEMWGGSMAMQMALLSGVKVNNRLRLLYTPGESGRRGNNASETKSPAHRIRDVKDCLSDEEIGIGELVTEEEELFGLMFGNPYEWFLTRAAYKAEMKRAIAKALENGSRRVRRRWMSAKFSGVFGGCANKPAHTVYVVGDLGKFSLNANNEKGIRHRILEKQLKTEVGAMFIVNTQEEKEMLLKRRHTKEDKKAYPHIFRPSQIYDTFDVFTFKEVDAIQAIIGTLV